MILTSNWKEATKQEHWLHTVCKITLLLVVLIGGIYYMLAEHPAPPEVVEDDDFTVVCIGDSLTFGAGVPLEYRDEASYPALLQANLQNDNPKCQVLNYGLSGRTLMKEADRPYVNEEFYELSKEVQGDVYIIMLGSNDSKPDNWVFGDLYKQELKEFVQGYMELDCHPTVYMMQPSKAFAIDDYGIVKFEIQDDVIANDIYNTVAEVGEELGLTVIDLYHLTEDHPEWYFDGIHPNEEGNKAIADYIYSRIKESQKESKK